MNKEEIISIFLDKGFLVSPDFFDNLNFDEEIPDIEKNISSKDKPIVITNNLYNIFTKNNSKININWLEFEKSRVSFEKGQNDKIYQTFLDILSYHISDEKRIELNNLLIQVEEPENKIILDSKEEFSPNVIVLKSYGEDAKKIEVQDFSSYMRLRYDFLSKLLQSRIELQNAISISRLVNKQKGEEVFLIGLVYDKIVTKNGNILLTLEDPTGFINILINKNKPDLFNLAEYICLDEVIGINGFVGDNIIFSTNIFFPDLFNDKIKRSEEEVYAVFISDLHVGSNMFMIEDFLKFVKWINGEVGSSMQREVSRKVKYLFIIGDLVDGVGIYPDQDKELIIKDIVEQYNKCADLLSKIRKDIYIIICPGNHDALRLSIPQPVLDKRFAKALWDLPNIIMVSNPSLVNIHSSKNFEGFNLLLYHGYGFHYYLDKINPLRMNNARDNPNLILKYLLRKRHLAPSHGSTLYMPNVNEDPLIIDKVPDIFVAGELHRSDISNYKGIITINCSCWQAKTEFQEKTGNNPDPAKVPIFNLKTREVKILKFGK